jgi:4-hydroxybenzoate polyprenyltransferase
MALVALVCAASGLIYGSGKLFFGSGSPPEIQHWLYIFAFFGLLLPYFFNREASVEEPQLSRLEQSNNTFYAIVFTVFASVTIALTLAWVGTTWHEGIRLAGLLILAVLSFWYLGLRSHYLLNYGGELARNERLFTNKVLLPAFATCLVSFSFGWSMVNQDWAFICLALPIIFIVTIKELIVANPRLPSAVIVILFLVATIVLLLLYRIKGLDFTKAIIIGTLLTFSMGVAEVCKRVVRYKSNRRNNAIEPYGYYLAGSNWSSIIFPLLLCFLPLLIDDLPVLPIFGLLTIQYVHWHHFTKEKRNAGLLLFNTVLGFLLPISVCLQYIAGIKPVLFGGEIFDSLMAFMAATIAIIATTLAFFGGNVQRFLKDSNERGLSAYEDYDNCFFLFLFVMILTLLAVGFYGLLTYSILGSAIIRAKSVETTVYLLLLLLFVIALYIYNIAKRPPQGSPIDEPHRSIAPEAKQAERTALDGKPLLTLFILTMNVGRLPVGVIAGLAVTFILSLHSNLSVQLMVLHLLPICLVTMTGFVLNDIFDLNKDRKALRNKPIAVGLVSVQAASLFAVVLTGVALLISASIFRGNSFYVILAAISGVIVYSWWAQAVPTLKGFATAILCCAPFAYATEVAAIQFPVSYYGFLLAFIAGRELLLDVKDYEGDKRAGIYTLVAYLNPSKSRILGWALMTSSVILVMFSSSGLGQLLFLLTLLSLGICLSIYVRNEQKGLAWSRVTLFAGVLATAFSL